MRPLDDKDDATMKVWWWLRGTIEDGMLLSICLAVLEEDLDTLETISKVHFSLHLRCRRSFGNRVQSGASRAEFARCTAGRFPQHDRRQTRTPLRHGTDVPGAEESAQLARQRRRVRRHLRGAGPSPDAAWTLS